MKKKSGLIEPIIVREDDKLVDMNKRLEKPGMDNGKRIPKINCSIWEYTYDSKICKMPNIEEWSIEENNNKCYEELFKENVSKNIRKKVEMDTSKTPHIKAILFKPINDN